MQRRNSSLRLAILGTLISAASPAFASVLYYGDQDLLGMGSYGSDPTAGASLEGLAANAVTVATNRFGHAYPFSPAAGDFAGTDQIYVGSVQTGASDGYSQSPQRLNGPQVVTLDYSALVPAGAQLATLTLGIAADDFQYVDYQHAPYVAKINGVEHTALTAALNGLEQGGPVEQFLSIGLDPALLSPNKVLTLSIDQTGDGGDGWAVDFFTVGVTTSPVPVPAAVWLLGSALGGLGALRRRV